MIEDRGKAPGRRLMDIEDALHWAFRDELPKRQRQDDGGEPCAVSPMFRICDLGVRIDDWSREPGFPAALGEPHPDALKIEAAVAALARFHHEKVGDGLDLAPDFAHDVDDETAAMRHAFLSIDGVVVRMAKLRRRPFWQTRPTISGVMQPNGRPLVLRIETVFSPKFGGGEVAEDVLVPVAASGKHYPSGAYCPLRYDQDARVILGERAEYLAWWAGLNALAGDLFDDLESIAVLPPSAAQKPWLGERERGKPPRIFQDLTARVYQKEDRQLAAAHRALGQRRVMPARRGAAATIIARWPKTPRVARTA